MKIFGSTYHKTGTALINLIIKEIVPGIYKKYTLLSGELPLKKEEQNILNRKNIFAFFHASKYGDVPENIKNFKAIHCIRNPFEVIVSGYNYHKKCNENWCINENWKNYGKTYQDIVNELSVDDGLNFEIKYVGSSTITQMTSFQYYDDPRFLILTMEDFFTDYDTQITKIAEFLNLDVKQSIKKAKKHDKNSNKCKYTNNKNNIHMTNTSSEMYKYPKMLSQEHKNKILKIVKENQTFDFMKRFNYKEN